MVDPWIEGLWEALKKTFANMSTVDQQGAAHSDGFFKNPSSQETNSLNLEVDLHLLKLSETDLPKESTPDSSQTETLIPLVASLKHSVAPLSESVLNVPALPSSYLDVLLENLSVEEVLSLET